MKYSELKRSLAAAFPVSIEKYMDGKDAFIKEVDRLAAGWRTQPVKRTDAVPRTLHPAHAAIKT